MLKFVSQLFLISFCVSWSFKKATTTASVALFKLSYELSSHLSRVSGFTSFSVRSLAKSYFSGIFDELLYKFQLKYILKSKKREI